MASTMHILFVSALNSWWVFLFSLYSFTSGLFSTTLGGGSGHLFIWVVVSKPCYVYFLGTRFPLFLFPSAYVKGEFHKASGRVSLLGMNEYTHKHIRRMARVLGWRSLLYYFDWTILWAWWIFILASYKFLFWAILWGRDTGTFTDVCVLPNSLCFLSSGYLTEPKLCCFSIRKVYEMLEFFLVNSLALFGWSRH